ncbi:hypothetical protein I550_1923 [Mycobacterium intracellulare 1956]|uniref:Uncharacterized protein n=1 Tax=Mycobacterium intracellulare 1956 TaxID=1299331 RepID=X8CU80_MYCIT|nr:hypothetical protein I550_1923 [Mycobacterium intracellulare 1956]
MSHNVLQNVIAPEEIVWHETGLGPSFWVSDELAGDNYSTRFSAQLTKFGPAGDPRRIITITTMLSVSCAGPASFSWASIAGRPRRAPSSRCPPTSCTV